MVADRSQVSDGIYMTVEQYLALDEATDAKYEYDNGYVFMLRPPSSAYDDEAIDMACGEQTGTMLINPTVVIEVLSPSTEKRDRGAKFKIYKALPAVQEYVLIGSEYQTIEIHRREGSFWRQYHYRTGDLVELTSIGVRFPFDEVYDGIEL